MSQDPADGEPPFTLVVVGSYVQDHVWLTDRFPETGETRRALGFSSGPGGKGFNQAIAARRQGGTVVFVGSVGDDALAMSARRHAEQDDLPCRWHVCPDLPTAAASITVDAQGANRILVNLAANEALDLDFLRAQEGLFEKARVLLVQLEIQLDAVRTALHLGRRHGLLCMLNPAPVHAGLDAALLRDCDLITPNEHEFSELLERIAGRQVRAASLATLDEASLHGLCRSLGVATVIVTLGGAGCFVSHGEDARHEAGTCYRIAAEKVDTVDTVGAGDAFNGALANRLSQPDAGTFRDAVIWANRVAALSTETIGASIAMPTRKAVLARFGPA
jgi:ribokinase